MGNRQQGFDSYGGASTSPFDAKVNGCGQKKRGRGVHHEPRLGFTIIVSFRDFIGHLQRLYVGLTIKGFFFTDGAEIKVYSLMHFVLKHEGEKKRSKLRVINSSQHASSLQGGM